MQAKQFQVASALEMEGLGRRLARAGGRHGVVYLHGDLGAGKTTLVRGWLQGLGVAGAVKSPTYTLVEPYQYEQVVIYHFDFYRLTMPEELEDMGVRDYFHPANLCLVEWPERGAGFLPAPDLSLTMEFAGRGRQVSIRAGSGWGQHLLDKSQ